MRIASQSSYVTNVYPQIVHSGAPSLLRHEGVWSKWRWGSTVETIPTIKWQATNLKLHSSNWTLSTKWTEFNATVTAASYSGGQRFKSRYGHCCTDRGIWGFPSALPGEFWGSTVRLFYRCPKHVNCHVMSGCSNRWGRLRDKAAVIGLRIKETHKVHIKTLAVRTKYIPTVHYQIIVSFSIQNPGSSKRVLENPKNKQINCNRQRVAPIARLDVGNK